MDSALIHMLTFFIKLLLMFYIIVSIWYPVRAINRLVDNLLFKALILGAIIVFAMMDVPMAILLAACLVVAIVCNEVPVHNANKAPAPLSLDAVNKPKSELKSGGDLRIYDVRQNSGIPLAQPKDDGPNVKHVPPTSLDLEAIDMEIIKLSHVSDERLASVQTSAIEQGLVGYEEDNVATVDMETVLLAGQ